MSRIILVRHSKPLVDRSSPASAWGLSAEGARAAAELAAQLEGFDLASAWTSPHPKARQTAQLIADHHGLQTRVDADLRQHERGSEGFLTRAELEDGVERLLGQPQELVFGDETAEAVLERMERAVASAQAAEPDGDVLLVTHGTGMAVYVARRYGIAPLPFWRSLPTPCAVVVGPDGYDVVLPRLADAG